MTSLWPPTRWVAEAAHALDVADAPAGWERAAGDGADWVCSLPLRVTRGDRGAAVALADALAARLAARTETATVASAPSGHVLLSLTDDALVDLVRAVPSGWASSVLTDGVTAAQGRRDLDDPVYAAAVAHARLCRPARPGDGEAVGAAYGVRGVMVEAADALRVHDRLVAEGRPHHLMDWIARAGSAVVTLSDESARCGGALDPTTAAALREALADALRTVGVTPTERL